MAKSIHDKNQLMLPGFDGSKREAVSVVYEDYKKVGRRLEDILNTKPPRPDTEDEFELSQELAIALKQEIRASGMSREAFADRVNEFFGRTKERKERGECRTLLTRAMVDKMIAEPKEYPIHCYHLYAFQHVLGFGIINAIVGAKGGKVMSEEDQNMLALIEINELKARLIATEKVLKR